jgi:hydrophobe/amphiphile efflux-3 (HAE3) family protein
MKGVWARVGAWAVERPAPVIALTVLLTLIAAVGALRLEADRDPGSLLDHGSDAYAATQRFYDDFGDEPVRILVEGDLQKLLLSSDLGRILAFEACLSGNAKGGQVFGPSEPAPAPCPRIAEERPAQVVFGPATFLNQSAIAATRLVKQQFGQARQRALEAGRQAAEQARRQGLPKSVQLQRANAAAAAVQQAFTQQVLAAGAKFGLKGLPTLNDPSYVRSVVFAPGSQGTPKQRFSYLFPSRDAALITVRLRPGLDQAERDQAIELINEAAAAPEFNLRDGRYVVSGVPVIFDSLAHEVSDQIFILLAVALVLMALTLTLVFGPPLRLLPLALAMAATALTFGLLALVGGSLTMASIAVLPVLTGLAVDYAIQFQARFVEAARAGASPPRAAVEAAAGGGPMIATACLATAAGFLVLLLSPIPMVRGFGLLLVIGVALAFVLAVSTGLATLSLTRSKPLPQEQAAGMRRVRWGGITRLNRDSVASSWRAPRWRAPIGALLGRWGRRSLAASIAAPGRVMLVALALAVAGWIAGTRTELVSDIRELLPANLPALQDADELEHVTGVSGDLYVAVETDDLTDPALIGWMRGFEQRVLAAHGPADPAGSCDDEQAEVCPGVSLSTLFSAQDRVPSRQQIERILDILPSYFSQAVVKRDSAGPGGTALIAFGIKVMPLDRQQQLIDDIRAQVDPPGGGQAPPPGADVEVVGLPVLAADASSTLSGNRYLLTVAGLLAVALVLLAVYRSAVRALVPLVPIVLATGWSSLVIAVTGVPLNPMSATLGALVIAIATEFSVILSARYHEERGSGSSVGEALRNAYARTGAAVAASGTTAIAGFAVLALADPVERIFGGDPVRMLTDFGVVTVVDLAVALVGVMLVLPAALVWAESGFAPLSRLRRRPHDSRSPAASPQA